MQAWEFSEDLTLLATIESIRSKGITTYKRGFKKRPVLYSRALTTDTINKELIDIKEKKISTDDLKEQVKSGLLNEASLENQKLGIEDNLDFTQVDYTNHSFKSIYNNNTKYPQKLECDVFNTNLRQCHSNVHFECMEDATDGRSESQNVYQDKSASINIDTTTFENVQCQKLRSPNSTAVGERLKVEDEVRMTPQYQLMPCELLTNHNHIDESCVKNEKFSRSSFLTRESLINLENSSEEYSPNIKSEDRVKSTETNVNIYAAEQLECQKLQPTNFIVPLESQAVPCQLSTTFSLIDRVMDEKSCTSTEIQNNFSFLGNESLITQSNLEKTFECSPNAVNKDQIKLTRGVNTKTSTGVQVQYHKIQPPNSIITEKEVSDNELYIKNDMRERPSRLGKGPFVTQRNLETLSECPSNIKNEDRMKSTRFNAKNACTTEQALFQKIQPLNSITIEGNSCVEEQPIVLESLATDLPLKSTPCPVDIVLEKEACVEVKTKTSGSPFFSEFGLRTTTQPVINESVTECKSVFPRPGMEKNLLIDSTYGSSSIPDPVTYSSIPTQMESMRITRNKARTLRSLNEVPESLRQSSRSTEKVTAIIRKRKRFNVPLKQTIHELECSSQTQNFGEEQLILLDTYSKKCKELNRGLSSLDSQLQKILELLSKMGEKVSKTPNIISNTLKPEVSISLNQPRDGDNAAGTTQMVVNLCIPLNSVIEKSNQIKVEQQIDTQTFKEKSLEIALPRNTPSNSLHVNIDCEKSARHSKLKPQNLHTRSKSFETELKFSQNQSLNELVNHDIRISKDCNENGGLSESSVTNASTFATPIISQSVTLKSKCQDSTLEPFKESYSGMSTSEAIRRKDRRSKYSLCATSNPKPSSPTTRRVSLKRYGSESGQISPKETIITPPTTPKLCKVNSYLSTVDFNFPKFVGVNRNGL